MRRALLIAMAALFSTGLFAAEENKTKDYKALEKRVKELEKSSILTRAILSTRNQVGAGRQDWVDDSLPIFVSPSADSGLEAAVGNFNSKSEIRKARMFVTGASRGGLKFKFELDFAQGDADLTDTYLSLPTPQKDVNVHVGRMKEPFGFENASSSNNLLLMERSMISRSHHTFSQFGHYVIEATSGRWTA